MANKKKGRPVIQPEREDRAMAIPAGSEVCYQGVWRLLYSATCIPPYGQVQLDLEGLEGVILVSTQEVLSWRLPIVP